MATNCELWILGDFNINVKQCESGNSRKLNEWCRESSCKNLFSTCTRPTFQGGTTIDLILTKSHHVSESGTVDHLISGHLSIFAIRKKQRIHSVKVCARGRTYRRYSKDRLGEAISNANWQPLYNSDCPEEQWEVIMSVMLNIWTLTAPSEI